jgi:hypothetical protein
MRQGSKTILGNGQRLRVRRLVKKTISKTSRCGRDASNTKRQRADDVFESQIEMLKVKRVDLLSLASPMCGPPRLQAIYSRRMYLAARRVIQIIDKKNRLLQQWKRISILTSSIDLLTEQELLLDDGLKSIIAYSTNVKTKRTKRHNF